MQKSLTSLLSFLLLLSLDTMAETPSHTVTLHDKTFAQTMSRETVESRIAQLGAEISKDYHGKRPVFVCVLKGAFMFFSDLLKSVTVDCDIAFLQIESYHNAMRSSGNVNVVQALHTDIEGRDIIIVEDIVDTGLSMQMLYDYVSQKNPSSIAIATLLDKKLSQLDFPLNYVGFEIAPDFVVGYGLDYDQLGRNLPAIYTLVSN